MKSLDAFSALRFRNFRLFWFGSIISLSGTWMHQAAQGWLVFKLTDSPFYLGLASSAISTPILLFTLVGGVAADRFSKRNIILVTQIFDMFLALSLAVIVSTEIVTVWHVLIIAFFMGTSHAFEIPARQSFFIEMVGREELLNAIALNAAAFHGARMIGPAIAGIIMGSLGLAACFYINSLSFIAAIAALMSMKFYSPGKNLDSKKGIVKEFKEGLKYIFSNSKIYSLIIAVGIVSFFGFPYIALLPVYARDILGTGATGLGILMGCTGAGAFVGAVNLAMKSKSSRKGTLLALSGLLFAVALLIFSLSKTVWLSYVMLFLVGWGSINQIATVNSLLQLTVPDELRGRVMSSFMTVFLGMSTLGNLFIGGLAQYMGTQTALATGAFLCMLGIIWLFVKKKEILRL
jgi:MFS family permease